jgi:hypothetical protein
MPSSSVLEYLFPIDEPPQSLQQDILAFFNIISISLTLSTIESFFIKLKITHLKGAIQ